MPRSKTAALVASIGFVALVFPSGVAGFLSLLPGIDITSFPLLRGWGAVYLAAGGLVEWLLRTARPTQLKRILWVTSACVVVLFLAILVSGDSTVFRNFVLSLGVVVPFVVGSMDTTKRRLAALLLVLAPIGVGTLVIERPFSLAAPAVWLPAVFTLYSLIVEIPLFALGREWRLGGQMQAAN